MSRSVFIVESPFQLIQVFELVNASDHDAKIIIRLNKNSNNNSQLKKTVDLLELKQIKYLTTKSLLSKLPYFFQVWFDVLRAKRVYIGDINSFLFRYLKFALSKRNTILLDDGVATISQNAEYRKFRRFSVFSKGSKTEVNNFPILRSHISKYANNKNINIIIGGKLVEEKICSPETYSKYVEKCLSLIDESEKVVYIPHRGENESNVSKLQREFKFQVLRLDYPVELLAFQMEELPHRVFSNFSTALISMAVIYKETEFFFYKFKESEILDRKAHINNIYAYLEADKRLSKI